MIEEKEEAHGLINARDFGGTKNGELAISQMQQGIVCFMV